jgi:hypothetical protein
MPSAQTLIDLETRFWQSMVEHDTESAVQLLCEPALMVSEHGAMQFDHAGYRRMAEQGPMVVTSFELGDVQVLFPNDDTAILSYDVEQRVAAREGGRPTTQQMHDTSTWVRDGAGWRCAAHTETPRAGR